MLQASQAHATHELPDYNSSSSNAQTHQRHYAMHVSVGLAALCAWWYYLQDVPSLERKLLSVLLTPVSAPRLLSLLTALRQSVLLSCAKALSLLTALMQFFPDFRPKHSAFCSSAFSCTLALI